MNSLLLWLLPIALLLLFFGLPTDTVDDTDRSEPEDVGDTSAKEGEIADSSAVNKVPAEYQHHWERHHRNRRII